MAGTLLVMRSSVASLAAFGLSHGEATHGLSTCDVMHGETCPAQRHTDVPSTSVAPSNVILHTNTERKADTPKKVTKCWLTYSTH